MTETVIGPPGDLPVIPASSVGRPYTHGWMLTMNPEMQGPPVAGGPVGVMFNTLLRVDLTGRAAAGAGAAARSLLQRAGARARPRNPGTRGGC